MWITPDSHHHFHKYIQSTLQQIKHSVFKTALNNICKPFSLLTSTSNMNQQQVTEITETILAKIQEHNLNFEEFTTENNINLVKGEPEEERENQNNIINDPLIDWEFDMESQPENNKIKKQTSPPDSDNLGDQSPWPTFQEIQNSINILIRVMPEMFTSQAVSLFYQKLFKKLGPNSLQQPQTNGVHPCKEQARQAAKKDDFFEDRRSRASKPLLLEEGNFQVNSIQEKKVVVSTFCSGWGYQGVENELRRLNLTFTIEANRYDYLLSEIMNESYQQLKDMAKDQYRPLINTNLQDVQRIMMTCRRNFTPVQCQLLFKVMKSLFDQSITIPVHEGVLLLKTIDNILVKSNLNQNQTLSCKSNDKGVKQTKPPYQRKDKPPKFQLHKMWNTHFQKLMLQLYKQGAQFAQIRNHFRDNYPEDKELFTVSALRSMLFKIIRMAVRRLTKEVWKSGRTDLPPLNRLDDQLVKNIINCAECYELRRLLLQVYQSESECSRQLLIKVIFLINEYNERGGSLKKSEAFTIKYNGI